jgi:hypothetical protein
MIAATSARQTTRVRTLGRPPNALTNALIPSTPVLLNGSQ